MNLSMPVDETFCGKVALNKTNLIQPHGYLLIISRADFSILQVSENTSELLKRPLKEIPGSLLEEYLSPSQLNLLKENMQGNYNRSIPFLIDFPLGNLLSMVKLQSDYFLMEAHKGQAREEQDPFFRVFQDLKIFTAAIENTASIAEMCAIASAELKRISGFDKVMIYQFDQYWNGDVVAESMEPEMESYLGLKFPASDIPQQARELYRQMPYRLIASTDYEPVKLYPVLNPITGTFTDLSQINLRSVAAVHLEYLRNMKVMASMSTRILQNNELWGLIACHHRSPKFLSYAHCTFFELASSLLSARMAAIHLRESGAYKEQMQTLHIEIIESFYKHRSLLHSGKGIRDLLNADGVAIVSGSEIKTLGLTPSSEDLEELIFWLQSMNIQKTFTEPALAQRFEPASEYADQISGLLALPLHPEKRYYLLAFRQEEVQKISWSGNPSETVHFEPDGIQYHPRSSFRIWQQTLRGRAVEWSPEELEVAERFRNSVVDFLLNKTDI